MSHPDANYHFVGMGIAFGMRPRRSNAWQRPFSITNVSILVVLECALEVLDNALQKALSFGFNPCCFGMRPRSFEYFASDKLDIGFNPCCFGMRPRSPVRLRDARGRQVSILVVLECALEECGRLKMRSMHGLFQSLLFWNAPSKHVGRIRSLQDISVFQSLLFWNAPSKSTVTKQALS